MQSHKKLSPSKIKKLHDVLHSALLIDADKKFADGLIQMLAESPLHAQTQAGYDGLLLLLDQSPVVRAKTTRRFATKKVDVFAQNLNRFTDKERIAFAKSCHLLQMTDGCTVACAWCYLNAQPYVQYTISYNSIRRYLKAYAKYLPDPTRFYWATDPLDWYDGERSYLDLIIEFYKIVGDTKGIVTTTSLPMGTEITFLRLIEWFDKNLHFKQSQSFVGNEQHYLKNNLVKGLYFKKDKKTYDIHTLFDYYVKNLFFNNNTKHVLKISETDANYKRLKAIFDVLLCMGISKSCMSWIEVETRDVGNNDGIKKSGRAYAWENRDVILDNVSMACWDSTILFPGKLGAMEMCGVTSTTQRGLEFWLIEPGKQMIPKELAMTYFAFYSDKGGKKQYMLPYLDMTEYTNGTVTHTWTHYSLKRDIQTYGLLLSKTLPIIEFIAQQTHNQLETFKPWLEAKQQYEIRKKTSEKLLQEDTDKEVVGMVRNLMMHIEQKFKV